MAPLGMQNVQRTDERVRTGRVAPTVTVLSGMEVRQRSSWTTALFQMMSIARLEEKVERYRGISVQCE